MQIAPERLQKETTKTANNHYSSKATKGGNHVEFTNGYTRVNGHVEGHEQVQDRGRTRGKKDDKSGAEFAEQIEATLRNIQKDLERISTKVRALEERGSSSSQTVMKMFIQASVKILQKSE